MLYFKLNFKEKSFQGEASIVACVVGVQSESIRSEKLQPHPQRGLFEVLVPQGLLKLSKLSIHNLEATPPNVN